MAALEFEVDLKGIPTSYARHYVVLMKRLGEEVVERIRERTLAGLDANGKPFGKYKDGSGFIDLHDTGEMLKSMHVKRVTERGFEIGVGAKYARYVDKRFNFLALSKADVDFVATRIEELYFDLLLSPKKSRKVKGGF